MLDFKFPFTRKELEAAGYKFAGLDVCRICFTQIVFFLTPRHRRMFFEVVKDKDRYRTAIAQTVLLQPHTVSCRPRKGRPTRDA